MLPRLLLNLVRAIWVPFGWAQRAILRKRPLWIHLRLDRRVCELPPVQSGWRRWLAWSGRAPIVLGDLRDLGATLVHDRHVRGVVVEIPHSLHAGWASLVALRDLLGAWRAAGKQVVAYLPDGGGTGEVFVALAASRVLIAPEATLSVLGIASQSMYLKPLLERLGLRVEVQAAGRFKTAAEPLVAERMSDAQREQRMAILDALHREFVDALSARVADPEARARLFAGGLWRGTNAVDAGIVDAVCYPDQLVETLSASSDATPPTKTTPLRMMSAVQYRRIFVAPWFLPVLPAPYIAVVAVHGTIGLSQSPGGGGAGVPAVTAALDAVRRDRRAVAVVLHVDSPGGSALASDHIHREVKRLAQTKPVVACFNEVAASGGYYVAAPARRIVAQPTTITGSIGVISAKVVAEGLFERIGVRPQVLKTAPRADMFSVARGLDAAEREILERESQGLYRTFLGVVADGRGRPIEEIEPLAGGRVWCGRDALAHGLIDRLGGFDVALDEARALVENLSSQARARLKAKVVTRFAQTRGAPRASKPDALVGEWIAQHAPDVAALLQAHAEHQRTLLLDPSLCGWLSPDP